MSRGQPTPLRGLSWETCFPGSAPKRCPPSTPHPVAEAQLSLSGTPLVSSATICLQPSQPVNSSLSPSLNCEGGPLHGSLSRWLWPCQRPRTQEETVLPVPSRGTKGCGHSTGCPRASRGSALRNPAPSPHLGSGLREKLRCEEGHGVTRRPRDPSPDRSPGDRDKYPSWRHLSPHCPHQLQEGVRPSSQRSSGRRAEVGCPGCVRPGGGRAPHHLPSTELQWEPNAGGSSTSPQALLTQACPPTLLPPSAFCWQGQGWAVGSSGGWGAPVGTFSPACLRGLF